MAGGVAIGRHWNKSALKRYDTDTPIDRQTTLAPSFVGFDFDCDPQASSYVGEQLEKMNADGTNTRLVAWNIRRGSPVASGAVVIAGCAQPVKGGKTELTAEGKSAGGSYAWRATPSAILSVSGSGTRATVTGESSGHAAVEVEYQTPAGGIARATVSGGVAEVRSVNGGAAVPQIGLRDENGRATPPVRIPVAQDPPEGDLLSFPVADEAIATVANEGASLLIQGLRVGKTTVQAQTACGKKTGPVVTLDVVRCTAETIDKMIEKEQKVLDRFNQKAKKARELLNEPELQEAVANAWKHMRKAWMKAGEAVLTGAALVGKVSHFVHTVEHVVSAGSAGLTGWSALKGNSEAMLVTMALVNPTTSALAVEYEIYEVWHEWLGDLSKITSTVDQVDDLLQQCDRDREELDFLSDRREKICGNPKGDAVPPPVEPSPPPRPTEEPPAGKKPPTPPPPSPPPPVPAGEPPVPPVGSPGPPVLPPPQPGPPPTTGGFPIALACGCQSYAQSGWGSNAAGLKAINTDLSRTQDCTKDFENRITAYGQDLKTLNEAVAEVQQAFGLPQAEGFPKLEAALAGVKRSESGIQDFNRATETVKAALDGCSDAVQKAGELVGKVTTPEIVRSPRIPEARPGPK